MVSSEELRERLLTAFPGAEVQVRDLTGTGDQFEARIVSTSFAGHTMRAQHQLVWRELESWPGRGELHALALITQAAR